MPPDEGLKKKVSAPTSLQSPSRDAGDLGRKDLEGRRPELLFGAGPCPEHVRIGDPALSHGFASDQHLIYGCFQFYLQPGGTCGYLAGVLSSFMGLSWVFIFYGFFLEQENQAVKCKWGWMATIHGDGRTCNLSPSFYKYKRLHLHVNDPTWVHIYRSLIHACFAQECVNYSTKV